MSEERSRSIRLQTARELEERGYVDKAVALYLKAGAPGEAARLLVSKERYRDAGQLMLDALGVLPDDVGRLEGPQRNAAAKAARCFALANDHATANRILRALGMADEQGGARPSMPPDVLPRSAPVPSVAPPSGSSAPAAPSVRPSAGTSAATMPAASVRPPSGATAPAVDPRASTSAPASRPSMPAASPGPTAQSRPSMRAASPSPSSGSPSSGSPSSGSPSSGSPSSGAPSSGSPSSGTPSSPAAGSRPSMPATSAVPASRAPTPRPGSGPRPSVRPPPEGGGDKWGRAAGWKSGQVDESALDKAIAQLLEQGKPGQAARVAWDAGRLEDAARWFAEAGFDYETGAVLLELERFEAAIERLVRVPPDHKRHRAAGTKLVDAADRLDRFDFEIDRALARFAKAPPIEAAELPTYLRLADLYARHGFVDGARGALEQILLFDASHAGAKAALERMAPPAPAQQRADARAARPHVPAIPGSLPDLPPLAEFVALARQHAPAKRAPAARG